MGTLYVVGTPIGNLEDLSFRAKRILETVAVIACEDTRVTRKLLERYAIKTPITSLHQHSGEQAFQHFLDRIANGQDAAYVTDAGTPGIADPGGRLVALAHDRKLRVDGIPGPSAVADALSISGFPADAFLFLGFLPHKKGRQTLFQRIAQTEETVVLYESPHRLMKTLEVLAERMPSRVIAVCRELTKIHESVIKGTVGEVLKHFQEHSEEVRGEIVIIIGPKS